MTHKTNEFNHFTNSVDPYFIKFNMNDSTDYLNIEFDDNQNTDLSLKIDARASIFFHESIMPISKTNIEVLDQSIDNNYSYSEERTETKEQLAIIAVTPPVTPPKLLRYVEPPPKPRYIEPLYDNIQNKGVSQNTATPSSRNLSSIDDPMKLLPIGFPVLSKGLTDSFSTLRKYPCTKRAPDPHRELLESSVTELYNLKYRKDNFSDKPLTYKMIKHLSSRCTTTIGNIVRKQIENGSIKCSPQEKGEESEERRIEGNEETKDGERKRKQEKTEFADVDIIPSKRLKTEPLPRKDLEASSEEKDLEAPYEDLENI